MSPDCEATFHHAPCALGRAVARARGRHPVRQGAVQLVSGPHWAGRTVGLLTRNTLRAAQSACDALRSGSAREAWCRWRGNPSGPSGCVHRGRIRRRRTAVERRIYPTREQSRSKNGPSGMTPPAVGVAARHHAGEWTRESCHQTRRGSPVAAADPLCSGARAAAVRRRRCDCRAALCATRCGWDMKLLVRLDAGAGSCSATRRRQPARTPCGSEPHLRVPKSPTTASR